MEEIVVVPIENGAFLDTQSASISFVSPRRVGLLLLDLHWRVEELAPDFSCPVHELRAHSVVHDLEESPISASLVNLAYGIGANTVDFTVYPSEVDDRNVDVSGRGYQGWPVAWGLHITVRDHA